MIKITTDEAKALHKLGVNYGENGISHTHSHNKHHFLCEHPKNMRLLNKMRQSSIVKTVE